MPVLVKLLHDEKHKLRKLRLQQVREQEKVFARQIRKKFKEKEKQVLESLGNELKRKWEDNIQQKRTTLENLYLENASCVGQSHKAALETDDGAPKVISLEDEMKVVERYKEALKKLKADEAERVQLQHEKMEAKNKALEMERIRAAKIATLEPPAPDITQSLDIIQKHKYKKKSIDEYSSTYYHLPQEIVEKADPNNQVDARDAAKEEQERLENAQEEADRNFSEQLEKARLRHKHARSKMLLQKDHDKLLEELEHFERIDRQRRQDIVSRIPKHVFEPPHRRLEANEERQREIEHAFEDMYMAQTNYMGDVSVVQEPLPVSPATTDHALDTSENQDGTASQEKPTYITSEDGDTDRQSPKMTKDDDIPAAEKERLKKTTEFSGLGKKKFVDEAEKSRTEGKPPSKDPLKRILKKIDLQRDRWRFNKMKVVKEREERHNEAVISDEESEFSEGTLTITTEHTQSVSSDGTAGLKKTLLHPFEEAQRTREAASHHEIQGQESGHAGDIEMQKQLLQQQKLKLQLQQQQVLKERVQLQSDILQKKTEQNSDDGKSGNGLPYAKVQDTLETIDKDSKDDIPADQALKLSTPHDSLSSGILSEDGTSLSGPEARDSREEVGARSDDTYLSSLTSQTDDSRVNTNLGSHVLTSIPESVFEDDFTALHPMPSDLPMGVLSQPRPLHVEMPSTPPSDTKSPEHKAKPTRFSQLSLLRDTAPETGGDIESEPAYSRQLPVYSPSQTDAFPRAIVRQQQRFPTPDASVTPTYIRPTSVRTFPSAILTQPPQRRHMPDSATSIPVNLSVSSASMFPSSRTFQLALGNDTASYLQFYQEQLADQQEHIREQQRAIQERQHQRLEQLKQFQEQLRAHSSESISRVAHDSREVKNAIDSTTYWRSLIPTSQAGHTGSSTGGDTQSETEHRSTADDISSQIQPTPKEQERVGQTVPEKPQVASSGASSLIEQAFSENETKILTIPQTPSKPGAFDEDGNVTTSSLGRPPSDIVPPRTFDDKKLFPDPSELGLWSDSTVQLSSSDATKSSSGGMLESSDHTKNKDSSGVSMRYDSRSSSSSLPSFNSRSSSNLNRTSESTSGKSRISFESGPLSTSSIPNSDKSISSSVSDSNNNLMMRRMESSYNHFQEMIEEAKTLNEKYLSAGKQAGEDFEELSLSGPIADERVSMKDEADNEDHPAEISSFVPDDKPERRKSHRNVLSGGVTEKFEEDLSRINTFVQEKEEKDSLSASSFTENGRTFESVISADGIHTPEIQSDNGNLYNSPSRPLVILDNENRTLELGSYVKGRKDMREEHGSRDAGADISRRELSIIPEESLINDDDLSEGFIDENKNEPSQVEKRGHRLYLLGIRPTEREPLAINFDHYPFQSDATTSSETFNVPQLYTDHHISSVEMRDVSQSTSELVLSGLSGLSLSRENDIANGSSGLTLQEAFLRNRQRFVKESEQRLCKVKQARFRPSKSPVSPKIRIKTEENQQNANLEDNAGKMTQDSSSHKSEDPAGTKSLSDERQKISKQDMAARTKRLYQNLPDVRQKKVEKHREEMYAANRAKALEFQKKTRERLRKLNEKKTGKSKK